MASRFTDRRHAGRVLAAALDDYAGTPDLLILGLPRGGVAVAYEVALALNAPLDVYPVRKLGLPGQEELAMGAIASGGVRVLNREIVDALRIPQSVIDTVAGQEGVELARREQAYRGGRTAPEVRGKTVILVDDGLATGSTMRAAIEALRQGAPARIVVGVPVAAPDTCEEIRRHVDEAVCASTPEPFRGVGAWYQDFSQTSDAEVRELLNLAWRRPINALPVGRP